ncbi:cytochrome c nitrite reductase small subunit [Syntrophus gentianae]|uniref:Cytochrome c nitrite reductase small subunit n=1 Tax=Syntrophus gentianae TaxID=43775 RepID=A0A1H7WWJ7_9BACT|nr:NapC/NirT family cytochrome c [Syntrophus gentianae]SEM25714.1 cytochrome c nitrite reductase small subunit [Syntrophus gentianae]
MGKHKKTIAILSAGILAGLLLACLMAGAYHYAGTTGFCSSCHSMGDVHREWRRSLHSSFACIECHMPDANVLTRLVYKARAGLRDVYHETLRDYPAAISLSNEGRIIAEGNCLRCHRAAVENTFMIRQPPGNCTACHRSLVHGQRMPERGLLHD